MKNESVIIRATDRSLDEVCGRLPEISARHHFGVLGLHDLREKMEKKGVAFARECRVFEVCSPQQAKAILSRSIEVSAALPCRISVYQENGRTVLATIKPAALLALFGNGGGGEIAADVESSLVEIMDETCKG